MDIFQTLEDRENPDHVEDYGPFKCTRENAWMHDGYYFWEYEVNLSHWWGNAVHNGNYIICKSSYKIDTDFCWDLYNDHSAMKEFESLVNLIKEKNINKGKKIKARDIIEYLIKNKIMKYEAVRFMGEGSISKNDKHYAAIDLAIRRHGNASLNLNPPIQICFFKKNALSRKGFKIIYPEKYVQDDIVVF